MPHTPQFSVLHRSVCQTEQVATGLYLLVENDGTLRMNAAQDLIVAVGIEGVSAARCLQVGFKGTGQLAEEVIGTTKHIAGAHTLVGRAVVVEIADERLSQRVVEQLLA